jgi:hypothetical protein
MLKRLDPARRNRLSVPVFHHPVTLDKHLTTVLNRPGRRISSRQISLYYLVMAEQFSRWVPLSFALILGGVVLVRSKRVTGERRSFGQWLILFAYRVMRFLWAIVRGVDAGYLEFRQVLKQVRLETENERTLGKLVTEAAKPSSFGRNLRWAREESRT